MDDDEELERILEEEEIEMVETFLEDTPHVSYRDNMAILPTYEERPTWMD